MKIKGKVVSINISDVKGVSKRSIPAGNFIEDYGLEGDAHAGKWHRQVSLLGIESIKKMEKENIKGLCSGKFAENITTKGIILYKLKPGTKLKIGETIHEITQIGKKCVQGCAIKKEIGKCIVPKQGIFTKVLKTGKIKKNDDISIVL